MKKIGFIGGGNMRGAIIAGLVKVFDPHQIHVVDHGREKLDALARLGVCAHEKLGEWACGVDFWVWAVKPQNMKESIAEIAPYVKKSAVSLTIAAGIESSSYRSWIDIPIMRAMPNTPAMVGSGTTGLWIPEGVDEESADLARRIFESVGRVVLVARESDLDLVGAIPGSGPAYVFRFMESLMKAGVERGLSPQDAKALALGTVYGAARLAFETGEDFDVLRKNVTSKGGTTAKALEVMNERGVDSMMNDAVDAALKRTNELKELFR